MPITIQTVSEVPECPFWYGIYSNQALLDRIIICSLTNRRNLCFFPVNKRARPLTRLHEIRTVGDWFQILLCPNRTHICFLRDGTFFKFPQRSILIANLVHMAFFNQLDVIKTSSKAHCSSSPGRILSGHNFQSSTFEAPKFSQSFLPLPFRWVLPAGLGLGPRLPRQSAAALCSRQLSRPRCGSAASRGQGSSECGWQQRPWPWTKDLGGENFLRQWDL